MTSARLAWAFVVLMAGCAHDRTRDAHAPAADAPYRRVERVRLWYRPDARCANGPFELSLEVPPARWGAHLTVSAIAKQNVPGHVDVIAGGRPRSTWRWSPPDVPDERCHAGSGEVVAVAAAPAVARDKAKPKTAPKAAPASAAAAARTAVKLAALTRRPSLPADAQRWEIGGAFFSARPEMDGNVPDLAGNDCWSSSPGYPTGAATVRVWFPVVRDLTDVAFEVLVEEVVPKESDEKLAAQLLERKRHDEALAAKRADACRNQPHDASCYIGCARAVAPAMVAYTPTPPPPPPRAETPPPRPSAKAEWIPGSWRWTDPSYRWEPGFWRLPQPKAVTVAAPPPPVAVAAQPKPAAVAPSPARPEPPPPAKPAATPETASVRAEAAATVTVPPPPTIRVEPPRIIIKIQR
jgi:hypothetical protein